MKPPGRFLKQDPKTKLWSDIGEKKALDKTRQALREGAPESLKEMEGGGDSNDDGVKKKGGTNNNIAQQQQMEEEIPLRQQPNTNNIVGRDALKYVDPSSSIVYHASLQFPSGFIAAIHQSNPKLARNLTASKVGEASTKQNFLNKMSNMAMYFPFGKLVYTAFVIPPGLEFRDLPFISEDAEKAFHIVFTYQHAQGEWYCINNNQKQEMRTRLENIGCTTIVINATLNTAIRQNSSDGPPGWNYFAKLLWSENDKDTITSVGNNNSQWKGLCDTMLGAVKVGCSIQLEKGKQELEMTDYKSDDEEQNRDDYASGKNDRGTNYVWALSQLADTGYRAFRSNHMFADERALHEEHIDKRIHGEWFRLTEGQVDAELDAHNNTRDGTWVRKVRGGVKTITSEDVNKFLESGCITEAEWKRRLDEGKVKVVNRTE